MKLVILTIVITYNKTSYKYTKIVHYYTSKKDLDKY